MSMGPLTGFTIGVTADRRADEQIERLTGRGASCMHGPTIETHPAEADHSRAAERLIQAACEGQIDGLMFTARPEVERFLALAEAMGVDDELERMLGSRITSFCVGPVCAAGFTDVGLPAPLIPERRELEAMVQQVTDHFSARSVNLVLAGVPVRYQGRAVSIEYEVQPLLSARERSLLDILMERPGVVHHKKSLLERVWGDRESDEHVVEVTVGRLRQRLGDAGLGIETVIKRGYRLSVEQ